MNTFYNGGLGPQAHMQMGGMGPGMHGPGFAPGYQSFGGGPGIGVPLQASGVGQPVPPTGPTGPIGMGFNMGGMWGVNDATAQMGMQLGRSAVHAGQEYVEKSVGHISLCFYSRFPLTQPGYDVTARLVPPNDAP
jgi:hypothetical protein